MLTFTFAGMAGNQVLEWADLDTEIKTSGLKSVNEKCRLLYVTLAHRLGQDPLAPPDLYGVLFFMEGLGNSIAIAIAQTG